MSKKPLGGKAYGSIPHLIGSRVGPADHTVHEGQHRICTEKARDKHDTIIVQEKLDGSNVVVARHEGQILALTRAGYLATTSPYEQHHRFAEFVKNLATLFTSVLYEGDRIAGEWLLQAHGTRYKLTHVPFVPFDILKGHERLPFERFKLRIGGIFPTPRLISYGAPISIEQVEPLLEPSGHGALDPVEGAVWRVERRGKVDFLAKYVRPNKKDGCYLPEINGTGKTIWNELSRLSLAGAAIYGKSNLSL